MKNTIEFSKTEGKQKAAANMRQLSRTVRSFLLGFVFVGFIRRLRQADAPDTAG